MLVSQVVTQRDAHLHNTPQMSAAFREAYPAGQRPLLVVGGPRFDEARPPSSASTGSSAAAPPRARWPATSCTPCAPAQAAPQEQVDDRVGLTVTHRRYVPYSHAHYAGNLVDGAYALAAFGDVATEVCIRTDGDEGLFASYSDVQFKAPVRAGDVLEIEAAWSAVGTRSREIDFEVRVVCRGAPERGESAAEVLDPPVVATTAPRRRRGPASRRPTA